MKDKNLSYRDKSHSCNEASGTMENVDIGDLRNRKDCRTAYFLWLVGGALGVHHFYLERYVHGLLAMWTFNFLYIGYMVDFCFLPCYIYWSNKGVSKHARREHSRGKLFILFPVLLSIVFRAVEFGMVQIPVVLHGVGLADLEATAAGTAQNPYDILEVHRRATRDEVDKSFTKMRKQKDLKSVKKAYQYAIGKSWDPEGKARRGTKEFDESMAWYLWGDVIRKVVNAVAKRFFA